MGCEDMDDVRIEILQKHMHLLLCSPGIYHASKIQYASRKASLKVVDRRWKIGLPWSRFVASILSGEIGHLVAVFFKNTAHLTKEYVITTASVKLVMN